MKKILPLVWMLFILVELVINFLQYYFTPIDGDLVAIVLPADWYSQVLGDPTGLKTIQNGDLIGGAGRSMAHWTMYLYYHHVPQLLQHVVNPIESVYLASALFKMIAMMAFVTAFTLYNQVHTKTFGRVFLFTPILILPLIQYRGFYDVMRTVDQATTYVFFYLWPVALFMLFYYPIYRWVQAPKSERVSPTSCILLGLFAMYIALDGPLMPPLFILFGGAVILITWLRNPGLNGFFLLFKTRETILIAFTMIFSLYVYYLGTFNVESAPNADAPDLLARYKLLFQGIYILLTYMPGLSLLLIYTIILSFILNRHYKSMYAPFQKEHLILLAIVIVYIALLPLGGYRPYRPYIIRSDTSLPALAVLFFIFTQVNLLSMKFFTHDRKKYLTPILSIFLLVFFARDLAIKKENQCEMKSMEMISETRQVDTVRLDNTCNFMSWEVQSNPYFTHFGSKMLQEWNITDHYQPYVQKKKE
ncbi:MAG: hypothetical protein LCH44_07795 [Bacteroidetes bacterium]|jgi:hypothetical protein|nr:hypothetical protein [Bacteroidota bacterium]